MIRVIAWTFVDKTSLPSNACASQNRGGKMVVGHLDMEMQVNRASRLHRLV